MSWVIVCTVSSSLSRPAQTALTKGALAVTIVAIGGVCKHSNQVAHILNLLSRFGGALVLFIGKNQQCRSSKPLLFQEIVEFVFAVLQPPRVCTVYDPDQCICLLKIIPPVGSERLLSPYVPDIDLRPA